MLLIKPIFFVTFGGGGAAGVSGSLPPPSGSANEVSQYTRFWCFHIFEHGNRNDSKCFFNYWSISVGIKCPF